MTVAQFREFQADEGGGSLANHPVVEITWHDAVEYCQWLTERLREWSGTPEPLATLLKQEGWRVTLPSEAEWEKAARGTDGRIYPWGDEFDAGKANTGETGIGHSSAVGCFPQGSSSYGCQDMAGNVWEWTRSLYGQYPYPPNQKEQVQREDITAGNDRARVLRGGSYWNFQWGARCAYRLRHAPLYRLDYLGFRLVVRP